MKLFLKIVYICSLCFFLFSPALADNMPLADKTAKGKFLAGQETAATEMGYTAPVPLSVIIGNVIKVILSLLGVVFLALMVYGGFKWMKASGRESDVEAAKKIIENAIIGLVLVFGAYALTVFIASGLAKTATGI